MPRNRLRTSNRANWTEEALQLAIKEVENGNSKWREIKRKYGIPVRTLKRRIQKGDFRKHELGPECSLGRSNEDKLVLYIQELERCGFATTPMNIRSLAYSFAEKNVLPHKFNSEKQLAGIEWFRLFMSCHPNLAIRKPIAVSLARAQGMCREETNAYFTLLEKICIEHNLFSTLQNIFNMDETGLQMNNKMGKVIATKGAKTVQCISSGEKGETISVMIACNAEGTFLPPFAIMKGKYLKKEFLDGSPSGTMVVMSEKSSYATSQIFLKWLKEMFIPRKPAGKVLLILDGHSSHCSNVDVLDYVSENNVILLCLPSHTTHWLQPLDKTFFKSFKTAWNNECTKRLRMNPGRNIKRLQFPTLLKEAWDESATVRNAVSGFEACDIYPFNPQKIPDYAFIKLKENAAPNNAANAGSSGITTSSSLALPSASNSGNLAKCSFADIQPIAVIPRNCRNKKKQGAENITSPEYRAAKRQKMKDKAEKIVKKKGWPQKTVTINSKRQRCLRELNSSSSEEELPSQSSTEDDELDEDNFCCHCGGYYFSKNAPKVDWISCVSCNR